MTLERRDSPDTTSVRLRIAGVPADVDRALSLLRKRFGGALDTSSPLLRTDHPMNRQYPAVLDVLVPAHALEGAHEALVDHQVLVKLNPNDGGEGAGIL